MAAAYNFGVVTLSGAYEAVKDVYSGTRGTTPLEDNDLVAGLEHPGHGQG